MLVVGQVQRWEGGKVENNSVPLHQPMDRGDCAGRLRPVLQLACHHPRPPSSPLPDPQASPRQAHPQIPGLGAQQATSNLTLCLAPTLFLGGPAGLQMGYQAWVKTRQGLCPRYRAWSQGGQGRTDVTPGRWSLIQTLHRPACLMPRSTWWLLAGPRGSGLLCLLQGSPGPHLYLHQDLQEEPLPPAGLGGGLLCCGLHTGCWAPGEAAGLHLLQGAGPVAAMSGTWGGSSCPRRGHMTVLCSCPDPAPGRLR